jgi:hypothetical protein
MEEAIGVVLLGLAALGYWRAMSRIERTWGKAWGHWAWWTSIPLWAGVALLAGILGGPGWLSLVLVAGGIFAVVLITQRSLRGSR